jgi:2-oxoglutarate dehydrogenase E1 component
MAVSAAADFAEGTRFLEIIDDPTITARGNKKVKRVLLCSGKVYFDLAAYQAENNRSDVAIVRLEQIYPIPHQQLQELVKRYDQAELIWVQEEPANMGAWFFMNAVFNLPDIDIDRSLRYVGRTASASPATGFKKRHDEEQLELVQQAFA